MATTFNAQQVRVLEKLAQAAEAREQAEAAWRESVAAVEKILVTGEKVKIPLAVLAKHARVSRQYLHKRAAKAAGGASAPGAPPLYVVVDPSKRLGGPFATRAEAEAFSAAHGGKVRAAS